MITLDIKFEGENEEHLTFEDKVDFEVKFSTLTTEFNLSFEVE